MNHGWSQLICCLCRHNCFLCPEGLVFYFWPQRYLSGPGATCSSVDAQLTRSACGLEWDTTDLYFVGLVRWHLKKQYWRVNKSAKAGQSAGVFVFFKCCRGRIIKKDNPVNLFDSEKKGGAVHDVSLSSSPARHRQLCSRTVTATSAKSKGKKSKVISS